MSVCGEDAGAARTVREAGEISDHAAGLPHDEHTCRGVPRMQTEFPEAVEATAGNGAEIESSGTVAANTVRAQSEFPVVVNVSIAVALMGGEAGGDQTRRQFLDRRNMDAFVIE